MTKNKKRTYIISSDGGGGGTVADLFNKWERNSESLTGIKGKDWNSRGGNKSGGYSTGDPILKK